LVNISSPGQQNGSFKLLLCVSSHVLRPCCRVYLISVVIFELGSLFCGIARNISFLIFGRAVAGVGGAGIYVSIFTIIAQIIRLKDRPVYIGFFGGVFGISSVCLIADVVFRKLMIHFQVIGPLIGGTLTDNVSWRWCFYINLPIGALSILAICLILEARPPVLTRKGMENLTIMGKIRQLDLVGTVLSIGSICCLLLALQWGGHELAWKNATVIGLLCAFPVIFFLFVLWEHRIGDKAMMPLILFKRKTQ
jgi:MFS family permease